MGAQAWVSPVTVLGEALLSLSSPPLPPVGDLPPWRLHTWLHAGEIPNLVSRGVGIHIPLRVVAACRQPACVCVHAWEMFVRVGDMWKQMLPLPLCFPTKAFKILDVRSPSHPPISCSPLFVQLYGDAICRPGPGSHHEEAPINRSHHRVPFLPASKRTQGEFVSVILSFWYGITPYLCNILLCIWSRRAWWPQNPRQGKF